MKTYKRKSPNVLENKKQSWICQVEKVHNKKYDYSKVNFLNQRTKVEIICPIHGSFFQRPCDHKNSKQGCPKCSHNYPLTKEDFLERSKNLYGDKFNLLSDFNGIKHPITLYCSEHGSFTLKVAEVHFRENGGCPKCWYNLRLSNLKPGNISKREKEWLDTLGVPLRQQKIVVNNKTYLVDGYDPQSNTIYEYYGSFWHGNPEKYSSTDINSVLNETFGNLYQKTIEREQNLRKYYNLKTFWD